MKSLAPLLLLLLPLLFALTQPARAVAQDFPEGFDPHGGRRRGGEPGDPAGPRENRIQIPESRDLEVRCRRAEAEEAAGNLAQAVRIYLEILREGREPEEGVQPLARVGENRFMSYTRFARERLLAMAPEGRKAFRAIADAEARTVFDDAVLRHDARALELVYRTYPLASCADEALERLGDLALEGGEADLAAGHYETAATLPGGDLDPKRVSGKLALARELRDAPRPVTREAVSWPVVGGDNAHSAELPPLERLSLAARAELVLPPSRAAQAWGMRPRRIPRLDGPFGGREEAYPELMGVAAEGRAVLTNGSAIVCYDLRRGERLWYQAVWAGMDRNPNIYHAATIAEGRVLVPFIRSVSRAEHYRGIPIREEIPSRRLMAFDLATGKRLWDHAESADPFLRRASVTLPPVVRDGVAYALAIVRDGAVKYYVLAVDARTGVPVYRRYLGSGQVELTMFGEHAIEPLGMQPAEERGRLFVATACGTVAALSARTGEIEWLATYETIPLEAARTYYAVERELGWKNSPPVVAHGALVVAPLDSEKAYAFDVATGALRWAVDRGGRLRRVIGVRGATVALQGDAVHAYDIRSGKLVSSFPNGQDARAAGLREEEAGHGIVCGEVALVPLPERVARIDLRSGERLADLPISGGIKNSGALLYLGRDLVFVNPQRATVVEVMEAAAPPGPETTR